MVEHTTRVILKRLIHLLPGLQNLSVVIFLDDSDHCLWI